jgi:hypothetical protein
VFQTSDNCVACHNGLETALGEDVSIGVAWRASMMANSSRDPYWQAAVRRETLDHPAARAGIEDECSICHMPMARMRAKASGGHGEVFAHLPLATPTVSNSLAADGVSCAVCHQISPLGFGTPASFTGGFSIPLARSPAMLGPFEVDRGRTAIMRSATGAAPRTSSHVQQSELCATCHTLFTNALGPKGEVVGSLPEQVPYLEWRHSAFRDRQSCQDCHMPVVSQPAPIASVLGEPRQGFSRHTFLGGNFFMLRMLNRYRTELGVTAQPAELEAATDATVGQLQSSTALVSIASTRIADGRLIVDVDVTNQTGHKLPTGYPSRRAWLHVTVRDGGGRVLFESGAVDARGAITGNEQDADASRIEPHYDEIRDPGEVQIYEAVMADRSGVPTTGLLLATSFAKDNRLLPRGFDKTSAGADIAVRGGARNDANFTAAADRVSYSIDVSRAAGPLVIEAELRYQPIAYRWAHNLARYAAAETRRFVTYYDAMSAGSAVTLARGAAVH